MICPMCKKPLYADEHFTLHQQIDATPTRVAGTYSFCPRCLAAHEGRDVPVRQSYPVGTQPPQGVEVCGVCRLALPDGDRPRVLRLASEDLEGTSVEEPGAYAACTECVERFKPVLLERFQQTGLLSPQLAVLPESYLS